ncbi:MAG: glycosyltransferase family 2 protein [Gammaproteobacteria bacterium]|nr:glycosyltransferase family 2 protein [Gammaproteobacteria bacterium]
MWRCTELISIIIPALNESAGIEQMLQPLQAMRQRGVEVILVDGGSVDQTCELAAPLVDHWEVSGGGRGCQMNRGAALSSGTILWFLHADSMVPEWGDQWVEQTLDHYRWGRFNVQLSGNQPLLRIVEWMMNRRSCWSGVATGDQGIFLQQDLFSAVGGFPEIPLMEDIAFSKQLKKAANPYCLQQTLITSSRRWEKRGVVRTILLMWWLRLAYWGGVSPRRIAQWYR